MSQKSFSGPPRAATTDSNNYATSHTQFKHLKHKEHKTNLREIQIQRQLQDTSNKIQDTRYKIQGNEAISKCCASIRIQKLHLDDSEHAQNDLYRAESIL